MTCPDCLRPRFDGVPEHWPACPRADAWWSRVDFRTPVPPAKGYVIGIERHTEWEDARRGIRGRTTIDVTVRLDAATPGVLRLVNDAAQLAHPVELRAVTP